ncbi:MAG: hypothetical protein C5B43_02115 [Verrucomicrobia bacterium]|nr:MAG: hypothetical protein C5B43_02115 [Verrucomicrobiota bacterium]
MHIIKYILLILVLTSGSIIYANNYCRSPFLTILNRWITWILVSLLTGYFLKKWELSEKPFLLLSCTGFLVWFLIETILVWLNIRMLNFSSIPFFPRFSMINGQIPWPNQKRSIALKEFLRLNGFKEIQSIKTSILGSISLNSPIYKDSTGKILLQLLFVPQKNDIINIYYILISTTKEGNRFITDNLSLPFGGYIPENWIKRRKPLCNSLKTLLKHHQKTLKNSKETIISWENSPLDEINRQQSFLEYYNIKAGFLHPTNLHDVYGKLTAEGRYRLWKQFLFLRYLGC